MRSLHCRPWHRDSLFADPRQPLDRERRAVWRARLIMFRRARKLTPLFEDIGLAMLKRLGTDGRLDPSHATIADDVACDARTVRRALAAMRACGLVMWVRRLVRNGWRAEQTSNGYRLTFGDPPPIAPPRCGGQDGRVTGKQDLKLSEPSQGSDEWGRWNAARQVRLLNEGSGSAAGGLR